VPGQNEGGYTGTVKLVNERAHWYLPRTGFGLKNLSLRSRLQATERGLAGGGEPSIAIGRDDSIYVSTPLGVPAVAGSSGKHAHEGVTLFRSHDHGKSWVASNPGSQAGGGDS